MHAPNDHGLPASRAAQIAAAAIGSFMIYILIVGLEGTGRHFIELGTLRVVLLVPLFVFAGWSGARTRRLGRVGLGLATVGAAMFVAGAIGSVATDGWSFDVFADEMSDPPWYAFVIGASGILFALGTLLVGLSGRRSGRLATAVILAGALFPLAFILGPTAGHLAWLVPWLVVAVGLARTAPRRPAGSQQPVGVRQDR